MAFHNGSNYDYHFNMQELATNLKENLIVYEKILKNTEPFQFQELNKLKKSVKNEK